MKKKLKLIVGFVIADKDRIKKYENSHVYCNGELCKFNYVTPEELCEPVDLIIFKYSALNNAIKDASNQIGEHTIILSVLNGISSEAIISETYGMDKILYCVAQGRDAVKEGNELTYHNKGMLCFGEREPGIITEKVKMVSEFFEKVEFPYEAVMDMYKRQWGKFMLYVGVNQTNVVLKLEKRLFVMLKLHLKGFLKDKVNSLTSRKRRIKE